MLFSHKLIADATKNPELELTKSEGESYTSALENVLRHYDVKVTQKAMDHAALLMTVAGIYGTRFAAIAIRKKSENVKPQNKPGEVRQGGVVIPIGNGGIIAG